MAAIQSLVLELREVWCGWDMDTDTRNSCCRPRTALKLGVNSQYIQTCHLREAGLQMVADVRDNGCLRVFRDLGDQGLSRAASWLLPTTGRYWRSNLVQGWMRVLARWCEEGAGSGGSRCSLEAMPWQEDVLFGQGELPKSGTYHCLHAATRAPHA